MLPSHSLWASPVFVLKKNGTNRVIIDYWRFNAITKQDGYPLPQIDDKINLIGGYKIFLAINLALRY